MPLSVAPAWLHSSSVSGQAACAQLGAVDGNRLENVVLRRSTFLRLGAYAVSLGDGRDLRCGRQAGLTDVPVQALSNVVIEENDMSELGAGGVRLGSWANRATNKANDVVIQDNNIQGGGHAFPDGVGISLGTLDARVASNVVGNTAYSGIGVLGACRVSDSLRFFIVDNEVDNTMRRLLDGAAVYVNGRHGTVVGNSVSHTGTSRYADAPTPPNASWMHELYLDDWSRDYALHGNANPNGTMRLLFKTFTSQIEGVDNQCQATCTTACTPDTYSCTYDTSLYGSVVLTPPYGYDTVDAGDTQLCP